MGRETRSRHGRSRTMRMRNGMTQVMYGGYVHWINRREQLETREVRVWGPTNWDPTYFGDGSQISDAVERVARKKWPKAECREVWRY